MSISWLSPGRKQPGARLPILENIHVAAPCPADWEKMSGSAHVRHCGECNLNVYNISEMTRREAENLIRAHEGRLCVRFYRRADGTILTQNCPAGLKALARRISRIAAAVVTAAITVGPVFGQNAAKSTNQSRTEESEALAGIDLTIVDPTGAVIPSAKAVLCQCKGRGTVTVNSDATGVAHFTNLKPGKYEVEVQAPGFKTSRQDVKLQAKKVAQLQVKLKVAPASETVEVASSPVAIQGGMGMVTAEEPTPWLPVAGAGRPAPLR
jgi:hypothetical protein